MRRRLVRAVLLASMVVAVVLASCAPAAQPAAPQATAPAAKAEAVPGVTKDTIKLGAYLPLSGAAAVNGKNWQAGVQSYFNMVNEKGGINGRKIEWITGDDQYQPPQSLAVTKKLVEQDGVFMMSLVLGSPGTLAVIPYLEEKKVPLLGVAGAATAIAFPPKKYIFTFLLADLYSSMTMVDYLVRSLGAKKVAIIYQNDDFGRSGLEGVTNQVKKLGMELAEAQSIEMAGTDFSSQVLKVKSSGADGLILYANIVPAGVAVQEMNRQGYKPKIVGHIGLVDPKFIELGGEGAQGAYVAVALPPETPGDAKWAEFKNTLKKYYPDATASLFILQAWEMAKLVVAILEKVGPDLTREKLVSTLESLKDFSSGGLSALVTFGPDNRQGTNQIKFVQVKGNTFVAASDWWKMKE